MERQKKIITFLKELRETIIASFEALDTNSFIRKPWEYQGGSGGGEIALLRGVHFEKAAVNWSGIRGKSLPLSEEKGPFFATGISLITHMNNPHAPTIHMNLRYIQTEKGYLFGGGYDLTPMGYPYPEDTEHFHGVAKKATGSHYLEFSKNAAEYFYIPHWKKERGVGGIFFDHFNSSDFEADYLLWEGIGKTFLDAIIPIYHRRIGMAFGEEEKKRQQLLRAHYVEFNLLYDRGTKFGFVSGGNPEAILCSMPPEAHW